MSWTCKSCGESHEDPFDSCWKCGIEKDGTIPFSGRDFETIFHESPAAPDLPCSTTPEIPGREIVTSRGIVCGEAILGANILRDIVAGVTDIVGGRSGVYESKIKEARSIALQDMAGEAEALGADAVVGVDIDYETVGGTMMMVTASGTAVVLKPLTSGPSGLSQKEIETLRAAYAAFNARDIDAALATMTSDVRWPKAFKGGFVQGPEEVRAYWTEQWSEINPNVEPVAFHQDGDGIRVEVHQIVRDLSGNILGDEHVGHHFTFSQNLIQSMEVVPLPASK